MQSSDDPRRDLVDLLPQFLQRRRRGWTGLQPLVEQAHLTRPALFLLRALVEETDPGVGLAQAELCARLFNPYSTIYLWLDLLPELVTRGYLAQAEDRYTVTAQGRALIERMEREAQAYLGTLAPLAAPDLARLSDVLADVAARLWAAPEPAQKPHQARAHRLPLTSDSPMARLDAAIYGLWTARDDAHNAAWGSAGFAGPTLDLLTRLWTGAASTLAGLIECVGQAQQPTDVERGVAALIAGGYVTRTDDTLTLTVHGRQTRDAIETETDRVYFAPWPPLSSDEVAWLYERLKTAVERLPG